MPVSNYPPGTWEGDPRAPWNQDDPATYDGDLLEFVSEAGDTEVVGCHIYDAALVNDQHLYLLEEDGPGRFAVWIDDLNGPEENISGPYADYDAAAKAILRWYPDEVQEAADEAAEEARIEAQFDDPDEGRY
jgi:hypothetical protein